MLVAGSSSVHRISADEFVFILFSTIVIDGGVTSPNHNSNKINMNCVVKLLS